LCFDGSICRPGSATNTVHSTEYVRTAMAAHSGDLLSHYVAYLRYCTASDRPFLLEKSEPGPAVARKGRRPTGGRGMYRVQLLLIVPDCSNVLQSPCPQDNRRETAYHQNIPYIALLAYLSTYLHSTVRMDRSTVSSAQLPSMPYAQCAPPPPRARLLSFGPSSTGEQTLPAPRAKRWIAAPR